MNSTSKKSPKSKKKWITPMLILFDADINSGAGPTNFERFSSRGSCKFVSVSGAPQATFICTSKGTTQNNYYLCNGRTQNGAVYILSLIHI